MLLIALVVAFFPSIQKSFHFILLLSVLAFKLLWGLAKCDATLSHSGLGFTFLYLGFELRVDTNQDAVQLHSVIMSSLIASHLITCTKLLWD
jgi:hypothetical protein